MKREDIIEQLKVGKSFRCDPANCTATITKITDDEVSASVVIDEGIEGSPFNIVLPIEETIYGFECGEYVMLP